MEPFLPLVFGLIGIGALYQTYRHYSRYRTVSRIAADVARGSRTDGETTVHGPVDVVEPATLERERPAEAVEAAGSPRIVAWRVRRKVRTGGRQNRGTRWRTADGGLAVGEFSVLHGGRYVRVDGDELVPDRAENGVFDPFDASNVHLAEPETEVRLGEPDPLTKLLERL
ncbi:hypothetical protein [Natrononativus amylolyticus]|uniref:hypothetical protein n=1 Tax=Natrononativus amylolyticus TaxID=2963434 RepID=UPI0020CF77DB|nr:hypothetical protein [Natrononativus amylolyticus]